RRVTRRRASRRPLTVIKKVNCPRRTNRWRNRVLAFGISFLFAAFSATAQLVYIGTYTGTKSHGIYFSRFEGGSLSSPQLAAEARNPSFLGLHPSRKFL